MRTAKANKKLATSFILTHLFRDRKSTRLNSSHSQISYAVFCLKKNAPREVGLGPVANSAEAAGTRALGQYLSTWPFMIRQSRRFRGANSLGRHVSRFRTYTVCA